MLFKQLTSQPVVPRHPSCAPGRTVLLPAAQTRVTSDWASLTSDAAPSSQSHNAQQISNNEERNKQHEASYVMRRIKGSTSTVALHHVCMECSDMFNARHISAALVHLASMADHRSSAKSPAQSEPSTSYGAHHPLQPAPSTQSSTPSGSQASPGGAHYVLLPHHASTGEPPPFYVSSTNGQMQQDVLLLLLLQLRGQGAAGLEQLDACGLAHVVLALGRLRHKDSELLWRLLQASLQRMDQFTHAQLGALITGLAHLGVRPGRQWRTAFYAACFDKLPSHPGVTRQPGQPPLPAQSPQSASMRSRSVAAILWALARLECRPSVQWLTAMLANGMPEEQLQTCKTQELVCVAYALGRLGFRPAASWCNALLHAALERQAGGHGVSTWRVHDCAGFMWGVARLRILPNYEWLSAMTSSAARQLHTVSPSHLAMLVCAVAKLHTEHEKMQLASTQPAPGPSLPSTSPHEHQPQLQHMVIGMGRPTAAAARHGVAATGTTATAGAPSTEAAAVAARHELMEAGSPDTRTPGCLRTFLSECLGQVQASMEVMEVRELSTVLRCCVEMRSRPHSTWLVAVLDTLRPQLARALPLDLTQCAYCLARLRAHPGEAWLEGLMGRARRVLSGFSPQQLANLGWALGVLGARPSLEWLDAWCGALAQAVPRMQPLELIQAARGLVCMAGSTQMLVHVGQRGHGHLIIRLAHETANLQGAAFEPLATAVAMLEK